MACDEPIEDKDRFGSAPVCRTVGDLVAALLQHDQSARVLGTWEGTFEAVAVYRHANGTVLVDADGCFYQEKWEKDKPDRVLIAD